MRLAYFADPMCSWCYGFGPQLQALLERHRGASVELVMGGLRAGNHEPMSAAFRRMLRTHWAHVAQASGLPFDESLLAREDFVYDTEPACRAVVAARTLDPTHALAYFHAVQAAFYGQGRDVTQAPVLAGIAGHAGYDPATFVALMESEPLRTRTRGDFDTTQALGVSGFPTLALRHGEQLFLVGSGYTEAGVLDERIAEISRRTASASPR